MRLRTFRRVVEGRFDLLVCDREKFHNTGLPYNKQGKWFLSTLEQGNYTPNDSFTGVVQSPITGIVLVIEMTAAFTTLLPMLAACFAAMVAVNLFRTAPIYDSLRERMANTSRLSS